MNVSIIPSVIRRHWQAVSEAQRVMAFDFYMDQRNMQPFETVLETGVIRTGICNAVAFWFELALDEQTYLSSSPNQASVRFLHFAAPLPW